MFLLKNWLTLLWLVFATRAHALSCNEIYVFMSKMLPQGSVVTLGAKPDQVIKIIGELRQSIPPQDFSIQGSYGPKEVTDLAHVEGKNQEALVPDGMASLTIVLKSQQAMQSMAELMVRYDAAGNFRAAVYPEGSHVKNSLLTSEELRQQARAEAPQKQASRLNRPVSQAWQQKMLTFAGGEKNFKAFYLALELKESEYKNAMQSQQEELDILFYIHPPSYTGANPYESPEAGQTLWPQGSILHEGINKRTWGNDFNFAPVPQQGNWAMAFKIETPEQMRSIANHLADMDPSALVRSSLLDGSTRPELVAHTFSKQTMPVPSTPKSQVMNNFGYLSIDHYTALRNVVGILKDNALLPPRDIKHPFVLNYGYTDDIVCLILRKQRERTNFDYQLSSPGTDLSSGGFDKVNFVFDLKMLDSESFRISGDSLGYGAKAPTDLRDDQDALSTFDFLNRYSTPSEIMMKRAPMDYLTEIWVHPQRRDWLLGELKKNQIHSINGRPVEDVVVSPMVTSPRDNSSP